MFSAIFVAVTKIIFCYRLKHYEKLQQEISSACKKQQCKAKNVFQFEEGRRNQIIFEKNLSEEHYILIQNVIDSFKEKEFLKKKKKKQIIDKYKSLLDGCSQNNFNQTSHSKSY